MRFNIPNEDRNKSGVYIIRNTANGKFYVGGTNCFNKRFWTHKKRMPYRMHTNIKIQKDLVEFGWEVFEFSILELCPVEILREREQYYLDKLKAVAKGYNIHLNTSAKGFKSPRRKISNR